MLKNNRKQRGFSMIEVLVSLLVIGIGLLGLSGLQIASMKSTNNAHSLNIATMLAMDLTDRMRANPAGVAGGFYENDVDCATAESACRSATFCSPEQIARIDVQELKCGILKNQIREGGLANLLLGATLTIDHAVDCDADVTNPDETTITIAWDDANIHREQQDAVQSQSMTICTLP